MIRLTRAFVEKLRRSPPTDGERKIAEAEAEFIDALAESGSDGVFGTLDPIPEQRPWPVRKVKEPPRQP